MDCSIEVFIADGETDRVTLLMHGASIVEYGDGDELVPACALLPSQARVVAEALTLLAKQIGN